MNVMIIGGTGFIGQVLSKKLLASGHNVQIVTRQADLLKKNTPNLKYLLWDGFILPESKDTDCVVNLAGRSIQGYWNTSVKTDIINSRIKATLAVSNAVSLGQIQPKVVINGSAMGYYGDAPLQRLDESSPAGSGFLSEVAACWEEVAMTIGSEQETSKKPRLVLLRTGLVLGDGGALPLMSLPFKLGLGAILGSGSQYIPWIHIEDLVDLILYSLITEEVEGPINGCSPNPVTMTDFSKTLAQVLRRPCLFKIPAFLLKAVMGEMSQLILFSQEASPKKALEAGYRFRYPDLKEALYNLFKK